MKGKFVSFPENIICLIVSLKVGESELKGIVNLEKLRIIQSEGFNLPLSTLSMERTISEEL